ncbi:hypothetical protein PGTDC60_1181 [Porphyromonas gingivalis TDC60]|nr:hypothetical protein PGTDC60_1181 [Porphyromonas gingivalis TDC60]
MTNNDSVHVSTQQHHEVAKFPHMQKYIFVYTPINFLIYGNIFLYIHNKERLGILLRNSTTTEE